MGVRLTQQQHISDHKGEKRCGAHDGNVLVLGYASLKTKRFRNIHNGCRYRLQQIIEHEDPDEFSDRSDLRYAECQNEKNPHGQVQQIVNPEFSAFGIETVDHISCYNICKSIKKND